MKVIVTGGSGKIGSVICTRLIESGHDVTALDLNPPPSSDMRFVCCDLRDRIALMTAMRGCDAVVHLGEIANPAGGGSAQDLFAHNTCVASAVLQSAADLPVGKVIYTSSCQVYGLWGNKDASARLPIAQLPLDETQPLCPQNSYAVAKVAGEAYARMVSEQHGITVTIFRLPSVITREPLRWLNWIETTPVLQTKWCDGLWSFVHVDDVAEAYLSAIGLNQSGTEVCHLAASDVIGMTPLAARIDACGVKHWPNLPSDWPERKSLVSTSKAKSLLNWLPRHSYSSILASSRLTPSRANSVPDN